jgi:hypothetical protein
MAVAALLTWIVTAVLGATMLATWVRGGGTRGHGATSLPPPVVYGHFLLAAAGLVVWVLYLLTDNDALTWVAFVDLVVVAVLGDVLVLRWLRDRQGAAAAAGGRRARGGQGGGQSGGTGTLTGPAGHSDLPEQHLPPGLVGAHGLVAVATVVLVLITALGVGVS